MKGFAIILTLACLFCFASRARADCVRRSAFVVASPQAFGSFGAFGAFRSVRQFRPFVTFGAFRSPAFFAPVVPVAHVGAVAFPSRRFIRRGVRGVRGRCIGRNCSAFFIR